MPHWKCVDLQKKEMLSQFLNSQIETQLRLPVGGSCCCMICFKLCLPKMSFQCWYLNKVSVYAVAVHQAIHCSSSLLIDVLMGWQILSGHLPSPPAGGPGWWVQWMGQQSGSSSSPWVLHQRRWTETGPLLQKLGVSLPRSLSGGRGGPRYLWSLWFLWRNLPPMAY